VQTREATVLGDVLQDTRRKNWFWDHNAVFESDLSNNAILVRLYLARCANGERQAWPSLNTIGKHCKLSKPTVIKALKELEEKGWLTKTIRQRPNQEHETTVYSLTDPPAEAASDLREGGGKAILREAAGKAHSFKGGMKGGLSIRQIASF
jgi:DNA-binding MarR family transcriptional regulator